MKDIQFRLIKNNNGTISYLYDNLINLIFVSIKKASINSKKYNDNSIIAIDEFTSLIDRDNVTIFENDLRVDNRGVIFRIYRVAGGFAIKADYWKSNCKDLVLSDDLILEPLANPQMTAWLIENTKHFSTIHEHPELQ